MSSLHPNAPQCHHVRTNGVRCGSPAMRNQNLCYYHRKAQNERDWVRAELPLLEDGNVIQLGIAQIMRQIMIGAIEYRAAQLMIDAYRLALRNLKNVNTEPSATSVITVDPHYDAENAGLVSVPVTSEEQQELSANRAFDPTLIAEYESIAAAIVAAKAQTATEAHEKEMLPPAGQSEGRHLLAQHRGPQNAKHFGVEDVSAGKAGINEPSPEGAAPTPDPMLHETHRELSDKEIDEMVMRLTGNQAYFMKEDRNARHPDSKKTLEELLL